MTHESTKPSRLPTTTSLWQPEPMPASDSLLKLKPGSGVVLAALFVWCWTVPIPAATEIDAARVKEIVGFLPAKPAGFGRPIADRAAWQRIARESAFASVVPEARELSMKPVPALPDELYLDFSKTGNRKRCEAVLRERQQRVAQFTLAECLTRTALSTCGRAKSNFLSVQ